MDADLTRERGLWGPPSSSQLDKWALDMVEGENALPFVSAKRNPSMIEILGKSADT